MRTTFTLEDDIYQAAKALAEGSGESLGRVVSALARKGLKTREDFAAKNGLPIFRMPGDAPVIPGDLAARLEAEEQK